MFLLFRNQDTLKATKKIDIYIYIFYFIDICTLRADTVHIHVHVFLIYYLPYMYGMQNFADSDLLATTENLAQ